jgi:hypothetical protein
MTKAAIILHLPIYLFSLIGLAAVFLGIAARKGERTHIDLPDGRLQYTAIDPLLTMRDFIKKLDAKAAEEQRRVKELAKKTKTPAQTSYWVYLSPKKKAQPNLIFIDYIFPCPICPQGETFDICRLNLAYDSLGELNVFSHFWRESIELTNYFMPQEVGRAEFNGSALLESENSE